MSREAQLQTSAPKTPQPSTAIKSSKRASFPGSLARSTPRDAIGRDLPGEPSLADLIVPPRLSLGAVASSRGHRPIIQPKLRFGARHDRFEREADRIADAVVAGGSVGDAEIASAGSAAVQRKCAECEAKEKKKKEEMLLMRKAGSASGLDGTDAAPAVHSPSALPSSPADIGVPVAPESAGHQTSELESELSRTYGTGRTLPEGFRRDLERRIGHDLSGARVHTDGGAARMASEINARAFTYGRDIYFASGEFNPETSEGQRLLVHELVHVVQQGGARAMVQRKEGDPKTGKDDKKIPLTVQVKDGDHLNPDSFMLTVLEEALDVSRDDAERFWLAQGKRPGWEKLPDNKAWGGPAPGTTELVVHIPLWVFSTGNTFFGRATNTGGKPRGTRSYNNLSPDTRGIVDKTGLTGPENSDRLAQIGKKIEKLPAELRELLKKDDLPKTVSIDEFERMIDDLATLGPILEHIDRDQLIDTGGGARSTGPRTIMGVVGNREGASVYSGDGGKGTVLKALAFNERVTPILMPSGWFAIPLVEGGVGYLRPEDVATDMPESGATLHIIQAGEKVAADLAAKHPAYREDESERDTLVISTLIVFMNQRVDRPGVQRSPEDARVATLDAGQAIWMPSREFVESVRDDPGFLDKLGAALETGKEIVIGVAGFVAGLVHGAAESLWDIVAGVVDLIKIGWDLFMKVIGGTIIDDAVGFVTDIYDTIKGLTWEKIKEFFGHELDKFLEKWDSFTTFERWHFVGHTLGYIIMEVITAFFSGGATAALKSSKFGVQAMKFLEKFPKVLKAVEAAKDLKKLEEIKDGMKLRGMKALTQVSEELKALRLWISRKFGFVGEHLDDFSKEAIEEIRKIPDWAQDEIAKLDIDTKRRAFGCASPCKPNEARSIDVLSEEAERQYNELVRRYEKTSKLDDDRVLYGFASQGELVDRLSTLQKRLRNLLSKDGTPILSNIKVGIRGSSIGGKSWDNKNFRWGDLEDLMRELNKAKSAGTEEALNTFRYKVIGHRASDFDFYIYSEELDKLVGLKGAMVSPEKLRTHKNPIVQDIAKILREFNSTTSKLTGRKSEVWAMPTSYRSGIDPKSFFEL